MQSHRRGLQFAIVVAAALAASCGGATPSGTTSSGTSPTGNSSPLLPGPSSSASNTDAPAPTVGQPAGTAGTWFPDAGGLVEPIEGAIPEGTTAPGPDGVLLATPAPLQTPDPELPLDPDMLPPATLPTINPCDLITTEEWASWAGAGAPSPQLLEEGNACGWTNADDTLRLALGMTDLDERSDGEWHPEIGANGAYWFEAWPVPQTSTLIATDSFDVNDRFGMWSLIVEVSGRGDVGQARLLETAVHFAPILLERLP